MSRHFKIILSILTVLAFALLMLNIVRVSTTSHSIIIAAILVVATIGAMKIIWKKPKDNGFDS